MFPTIFFAIIIFLYGITIGSFLNVCIYRLPKKENIVTTRSHCMSCGYQLKWYDLIPLFSWLVLGGKCRKCKARISVQYPVIEALNGFLWLTIFFVCGVSIETALYCVLASALLALSVIDFRTYEIPFGFNLIIAALGLIRVLTDLSNWTEYAIGFFAVSVPLYLIYIVTKGRGIGGGDIKLMAAAGLLLGWKRIVLALVIGCILGSVIHVIRMKVSKAEHVLAMGPYLSMGIFIAALWGEQLLDWYLGFYI
ncbi:MAG: prepilin peptidase [Lachnospiraceae bacterium]|nr:prepilin peptidase [Lachnospiraceae bacterium]